MDANYGCDRECKGAGVPLQRHSELLPGLGVLAQTVFGMIRREMTCGLPQGLVCGPLLWNITFHNILKEYLLPVSSRRYSGGYRKGQYNHTRAEDKHRPWGHNPLDYQLDWAQPQRWKRYCLCAIIGSIYLHLPKGGGHKALWSPEVLGVMVWWKADFQEACQADSSKAERIIASIIWLMSNITGSKCR